jgi:hypothetical protein
MRDDFLVAMVNHWEAAQILGGLYADERSMMNLLEWADKGTTHCLLISLDGKFGAVEPKSFLDEPGGESEVVFIDEGIECDLVNLKATMRAKLARSPWLAEKLHVREVRQSVPNRITLQGIRPDFSPETIGAEVDDAIHNVESATDDALVWIALVAATQNHRLDEKAVEKAARELQMRLDTKCEFRSTFFPLDQVTNQEITARARRAKRDLENCEKKFPAGEYFTDDAMFAFARRLSNDRLADLCVLMHYQENWGHPPFKVLLIDFGQRVWKALGRD